MTLLDDLMQNFYKDGTRQPHWGKILSSVGLVLLLIGFIIYKKADLKEKKKDRNEHERFIIGTTTRLRKNYKSSQPTVDYYYYVKGIKYKQSERVDAQFEKTVNPDTGQYLVQFSFINPQNSKLLLEKPVIDNVEVPDSGWVKIPSDLIFRNN